MDWEIKQMQEMSLDSFFHSFIRCHSFISPTNLEGFPSARQFSKHWDPEMSKADKTPDPAELYLWGGSARAMEERKQKEANIHILWKTLTNFLAHKPMKTANKDPG